MTDVLVPHGVLSGCAVTAQGTPNMTVAIAAGLVLNSNVAASVTAQNATITAADATNPRYDLISVDNTGTVTVTAGTPAATPAQPETTDVTVAYVLVGAGVTSITASAIQDVRTYAELPGPANSLAYTFTGTGASDTNPGALSIACDGSTLGTVTQWYVNYQSFTAPENERWLTEGAPFYLRLWSRRAPGSWVVYRVDSVTKHTGYDTLSVTLIDEGGPRGTGGSPGGWSVGVILSTDTADTILEREVAPSITTVNGSSVLGSDVTLITTNQFFDVVATASLLAGTYLVSAMAHALGSAAGHVVTARIWDGTTTYAEGEQAPGSVNATPVAVGPVVITLGATTTLKLSAASDTGTTDKVKAAVTKNSAGNFATMLTWVRVA